MSENWDAKRAHEHIDALVKQVEIAEQKAKQAAFDFAGAKLQTMKPYVITGKSIDVKKSQGSSYWSYDIKPNLDSLQRQVDEWYQADLATIEENKVIAENNTRIKNALEQLFTNLGFPKSTWRYETRRSSKRTEHWAGWRESLAAVETSTNEPRVHEVYKSMCKRIEEERTVREQEEKQKAIQREAEEKKQEMLKYIGTLEAKYNEKFPSVYSAIQHILSKDRYLRLAYYLEKNRNDWNDGPDYAKTGIQGFDIETDTDRQIHDEISAIIYDFEDGRSFRDCTWNYSVLYGMADETLLAELRKLQEGEEQ